MQNQGRKLRLSVQQGQRQLISIARAAVADPPVMILDEAISSIDTRTEALVQADMDNLMEGQHLEDWQVIELKCFYSRLIANSMWTYGKKHRKSCQI